MGKDEDENTHTETYRRNKNNGTKAEELQRKNDVEMQSENVDSTGKGSTLIEPVISWKPP